MIDDYKRCPTCGETKPRSEFYSRNRKRADGSINSTLQPKCIVCSKAKTQEWRKANPERVKSSRKTYYEKNRDKELSNMQAWKKDNKDKMHEWRKSYVMPEEARKRKCMAELLRHYNKKTGITNYPKVEEIYQQRQLLEDKLHACVDCDDPQELKIHVDHIIPIALGGTTEPSNLQLLSAKENLQKGVQAYSVLGAPRFV